MADLRATRLEVPDYSALFVGVPDALFDRVGRALLMPVRRESDVAAACRQMVRTRPYVVVVGGTRTADEISRLEEIAIAISAQVVILAKLGNLDDLEAHLKTAKQTAEQARDRAPTSVKT
jgi:hypothetical protein